MTEKETEQSNEPVESNETTESTEPSTIADVATKFNVEQQATEFQTQSAPETNYQEPDYNYDPDLKKLSDQVIASNDAVSKRLDEIDKRDQDDRLNRDVKEAVSEITKQVDLPSSNPDLMAELYLEKKYREDKDFKNIFDNRYANPQAMKAASKIIANEIAKDFNVQVNDQLVENVRAAKKSQSTTATAPAEQSKTDEMMNMSTAEFEKEWAKIKGH